ncbi:hypothetical protein LCGC14_0459140 [marine sediment metagenome]|uniref:Uncharacterized protein n=1 Tax=marine sediment metagenome TaxID=412755 RepID=A0A0F9SFI7_9ZZZZ
MEVEAKNKQKTVSEDSIKHDKEEWNDTVQLLIAKLIAFKKGLNGAGDDRAHLPPVDMNDPFPIEMSIYLNSIMDDYVAIVDGAKDIMGDQEEHSKQADEISPELLSQASWWGSRSWARLGLIGLGEQRKIRLDMIRFINASRHDLFNIENDLTNRDQNGIARAIMRILKLKTEFVSIFIPNYTSLMEEMEGSEKIPGTQIDKPEAIPALPAAPAASAPEAPEAPEAAEEEEIIYTEPEPVRDQDVISHKHIAAIEKSLSFFDRKIWNIRAANAPTQSEKTYAENVYSRLRSNHVILKGLNITPGAALTEEQSRHIGVLAQSYNETKQTFQSIMNKYYADWSELERDSTEQAKQSAREYFKDKNEEIIKLTHNTVTRWMNRKLMGLSYKKINRMKIAVVKSLLKMGKAFDQLMDILEDKKSTQQGISKGFDNVSRLFSETAKILWPLGKNYLLSQNVRSKGKDSPVIKIPTSQLNELAEIPKDILPKEDNPEEE